MRIYEIFSQPVSELRRNPQQNNQRIGLETVLNYLKSLPADQLDRTYVSGQNVNKLGINYTKPIYNYRSAFHLPGIYAWPARYFLNTKGSPISRANDMGRNRHYKYVFEIDPKHVMTDIPQLDAMINSMGGTEKLAKRSRVHDESGDEKISYALNKKLRDLGIGAITVGDNPGRFLSVDKHATVILATKYIKNVKAFVDKPEHIPASDQQPD
jgi:hypothetical protein